MVFSLFSGSVSKLSITETQQTHLSRKKIQSRYRQVWYQWELSMHLIIILLKQIIWQWYLLIGRFVILWHLSSHVCRYIKRKLETHSLQVDADVAKVKISTLQSKYQKSESIRFQMCGYVLLTWLKQLTVTSEGVLRSMTSGEWDTCYLPESLVPLILLIPQL